MVLEHRRLHTTNNNTQLHTTPHTTTRQHTIAHKVIFVRTSYVKSLFSNPTKCFKVAPRWSQDGPTWSRWRQDAPPWCILRLPGTVKKTVGFEHRMFTSTESNTQLHTTTYTTTRRHATTHKVNLLRTSHTKSTFLTSSQCP